MPLRPYNDTYQKGAGMLEIKSSISFRWWGACVS